MASQSRNTFLNNFYYHKCPRCRKGEMFLHPIMAFDKMFSMHEVCPHCEQKYVLEPGFYWGAMYVAYALSGGILLACFGLLSVITEWHVAKKFLLVTAVILLLYVWVFRTSRCIWLSTNVKYDKSKVYKKIKKNTK